MTFFTRLWVGFLALITAFAVWNPEAQPNFIPETRASSYGSELPPDRYGIWPTMEFTLGTPESQHISQALLDRRFADLGQRGEGGATRSFLVLRRGVLVYEEYYNGAAAGDANEIYSCTKSILSLLTGIAIGEGDLKGVEQKVIDFFPEAVIASGQESKRDMTIEHLLTMTSGLPGDADPPEAFDAALAFEITQLADPGGKYIYSSQGGSQVLADLLTIATGRDLLDYANEKLFGPLGITSAVWDKTARDVRTGGWGIKMTPRDMLKIGYLLLNEGRWEDRQIIPNSYFCRLQSRAVFNPWGYGYMFWNDNRNPFTGAWGAQGAFGQYITVYPKLDMVVVRTGTQEADWPLTFVRGWAW